MISTAELRSPIMKDTVISVFAEVILISYVSLKVRIRKISGRDLGI